MKLLLGLAFAMLLVAAASYLFWRSAPAPAPCAVQILSERASPDGWIAAAHRESCGHETTNVALRLADTAFDARGDVFIARGRRRSRSPGPRTDARSRLILARAA